MHFRPLHDRVVVRRIAAEEKTAAGMIVPDTAKEKPMDGDIVAVGPGAPNEQGPRPARLHDSHVDWVPRLMEDVPEVALGVLATFAVALLLAQCNASAIQAWHNVQNPLRSMAGENRPAAIETAYAASSYGSGRR